MRRAAQGLLVAALLIAAIRLAGAQPGQPDPVAKPPVPATLGEPFKLALHQAAVFASEGLELRFEEVLEDSRCPPGMVCVWAGRVRIRVSLQKSGSAIGEAELSTMDTAQDKVTTVGGYLLNLAGVDPAAKSGGGLGQSEYVVTLRVARSG